MHRNIYSFLLGSSNCISRPRCWPDVLGQAPRRLLCRGWCSWMLYMVVLGQICAFPACQAVLLSHRALIGAMLGDGAQESLQKTQRRAKHCSSSGCSHRGEKTLPKHKVMGIMVISAPSEQEHPCHSTMARCRWLLPILCGTDGQTDRLGALRGGRLRPCRLNYTLCV